MAPPDHSDRPPLVHTSARLPQDLLEALDRVERPLRGRMRRTDHLREAVREYVERYGEDVPDAP